MPASFGKAPPKPGPIRAPQHKAEATSTEKERGVDASSRADSSRSPPHQPIRREYRRIFRETLRKSFSTYATSPNPPKQDLCLALVPFLVGGVSYPKTFYADQSNQTINA